MSTRVARAIEVAEIEREAKRAATEREIERQRRKAEYPKAEERASKADLQALDDLIRTVRQQARELRR